MPPETAERELLIAAKAVEQKIVSPDELARAASRWAASPDDSLVTLLQEEAVANEAERSKLKRLYSSHEDLSPTEIARSIDDGIFGKLNSALERVGDEKHRADLTRLRAQNQQSPSAPVFDSDRFEIISEYARGGLGEVLLAEDRQLNRRVALKRIRDKWADNETAQVRFRIEAEITGRLEHPGVVPVYALGRRADGQIYYAMRFIRGARLDDAVDEFRESAEARLPWSRSTQFRALLRRFIDVCETIGYAHSRGIMHRDLKPPNILLGKYGETLVVDWGLAKPIGDVSAETREGAESLIVSDSDSGSAPTQFGSAVGTPQYMSPEQATGRLDRMGPPTDVFGLGATLYHVLTGQPPQTSKYSVDEILDRVEHGTFDRPTEVDSRVPKPLEAICLKAMALRPSERYSDPGEIINDIERWLADEPVQVYPDPPVVRVARWARRNRTLTVTSGVALILLTIGSIAGAIGWNRFNEQNRELQQQERERLAELKSSLKSTYGIVERQVSEGRFATAMSMIDAQTDAIAGETELVADLAKLRSIDNRLENIADFYRLCQQAEEMYFFAQDEDAITATLSALEMVDVWNNADWWNHLPDEDLDAAQRQRLRQAVYKQLVLLASSYTKQFGIRSLDSVGGEVPESILDWANVAVGDDGKLEARASIVVSNLANRFQFAESLRWYRGVSGIRLFQPTYTPSVQLKEPRNAADAHALGILSIIRAIEPAFPFARYRGIGDDLLSARETLGIGLQFDPDHYWTSLQRGQIEFLMAERAAQAGDPEAWRLYETARRTYGRCLALHPELPFAYADVSLVCLREREAITDSGSLGKTDANRIRQDLLESGVRHALDAVQRAPNASWAQWQYGQALTALDRIDEAMEAYGQAVQLGYRFTGDRNVMMVDVDRIRSRSWDTEAIRSRVDDADRQSVFYATMAAAQLIDGDIDGARRDAKTASDGDDVDPLAWAVLGVLALQDEDPETALVHLLKSRRDAPESFWATYGLGLAYEQIGDTEAAGRSYEEARGLARTQYHAADAILGTCRTHMRQGNNILAAEELLAARQQYPACVVDQEIRLAQELGVAAVLEAIEESQPISTLEIVGNTAIESTADVPVRNGDFELPLGRHWNSEGAATAWSVDGSGDSVAWIDDGDPRSGLGALRIQASSFDEGTTAGMQQTITVEQQSAYQISLWARSSQLSRDAVQIYVIDEQESLGTPVISLEPGSSQWQRVEGRFDAPPASFGFPVLVPMTLKIVCRGTADVWIDDITIERQSDR